MWAPLKCAEMRLLALLLAPQLCAADLYDVLSPHLLPPPGGCLPWSELPQLDQYWAAGRPSPGAGSSCAQQGKGNPQANWGEYQSPTGCVAGSPACANMTGYMGGGAQGHALGAYCVSKATRKLALCTSALGVPEQVNVQIAGPNSVVLSFVTFESPLKASQAEPPMATVSTAGAGEMQVQGVTHKHVTKGERVYYMHFIRLGDLKPKAVYSYTVKGGAPGAVPSKPFSFRAPYGDGETKIALFVSAETVGLGR